ncbi:MAG: TolC family protein, partial [Muribaculaceae bacterium]|nr:TolC family protein [Muribaculaceae bacterium]
MKYSLITIIAILLMSSCSGTKDLSRARVEMPASYMSGDTVLQSADSLTLADVKWWEFYSDTTLTKILRTALDNNRDILKAAAKVEQMRALYGVAKADMLPQIGLDVAYSYETNKYNGGQTDLDPEHDLKFPISWEVNLWGAMFHAKNAGKARFIASLEDYRA